MSWSTPAASGLTIAAVGPLPAEAQAAVAAAGARLTNAIDWEALDDLVPAALVIAAVPGDVGHGALERLATMLDDAAVPAVVAFEGEALDVVAATLMGSRVALLCDPAAEDWAAVLAVASVRADRMPTEVREGDDRERLHRLHADVARIAAMLAGLAEERPLDDDAVAERQRAFGGPPTEIVVDAAEIRRVIRARRMRGQFFDPRLLEDPGWDMLLDLFAAELEGTQVSVSSLCIASGVAPTTALRWISRMADAGLLLRVADPSDRRRAFLVLSPAAGEGMRRYVAAARRAGLPLA